MFSIDGITWDIPCSIEREAAINSSDISGPMLDRSYFNDVLGTYMSYTVRIAVPLNMRDEYAQIYEALTNPVDGHLFVMPYNDSTIEITARVSTVSDVYVRLAGGQVYWKGIEFTCVANYPTKAMTLGEMVVTGRAPFPDVADPSEGDTYTYSNGAWVPAATYDDADSIYY